MNKKGKKAAAYDKAYNARPEQKKNRAARNKARREVEKKQGKLPSDVDVDHKHRLAKGGTNHATNLRTTSQKQNRGWRRGKRGYG